MPGVIRLLFTGHNEYVLCRHAFLFSFVNPSGLDPIKLSLITGKGCGIQCDSSYGPSAFGDGNDLWILNNQNDANTNPVSISIPGSTYQCPPGQENSFFTDANESVITDYEVFGVHQ